MVYLRADDEPLAESRCRYAVALLMLWASGPCIAAAAGTADIEHALKVELEPAMARLRVEDRIRLSPSQARSGRVRLSLNAGLRLTRLEGGHLEGAARASSPELREFQVRLRDRGSVLVLYYEGSLVAGEQRSALHVDRHSVNLTPASGWYPRTARQGLLRYSLEARLPPGWRLVSSAMPTPGSLSAPVAGIQLVAAPFRVYRDASARVAVSVALRDSDPALAQRYLAAIGRYLPFYEALLGPYPYPEFSVVENIAPTGRAYPGFTLLGAKVMRLPFITDSSLPHEILHNWWGNAVLVDHQGGNWSEGLTSYLADHLLRERAGDAVTYRRDALARYRNAHRSVRARPLRGFVSRHDESSHSLGYDRALMVVHMVRRAVGDDAFVSGLRRFYSSGRHRYRSTLDLLGALVRDPQAWFEQWWARSEVPALSLQCCTLTSSDGTTRLSGTLRQTQSGPVFAVRVPLAVSLLGERTAREVSVAMTDREQQFVLPLSGTPTYLQVDAGYDLMRVPALDELPPSVREVLGASTLVATIPDGLAPRLRRAYAALAEAFGAAPVDAQAARTGAARGIITFHVPGAFADAVGARLDGLADRGEHHVGVIRLPPAAGTQPRRTLMVLRLADGPAVSRAGRRMAAVLPRYGRYGRLAFTGRELRMTHKAHAPTGPSPLSRDLSGQRRPLPLARREALTPASSAR